MGQRSALSHDRHLAGPAMDLRAEPVHGHDGTAAADDDQKSVPEGFCDLWLLRHGHAVRGFGIQFLTPCVRPRGDRSRVVRLLRIRTHDLSASLDAPGIDHRHRQVPVGCERYQAILEELTQRRSHYTTTGVDAPSIEMETPVR